MPGVGDGSDPTVLAGSTTPSMTEPKVLRTFFTNEYSLFIDSVLLTGQVCARFLPQQILTKVA